MATTNNTVCTCGARYSAFRSTDGAGNVLTFADVHAMMRVGSDDSSLWVSRSRGAVLRFWSFLKRSQWEAMHGYCDAALAADATADELPEWVTDTTSVDVGYRGDDETAVEIVASVDVAIVVEVVRATDSTNNTNTEITMTEDSKTNETKAPAVRVPATAENGCQRWLEGRHTYRPAREVVDTSRLEIAEIPKLAAKAFVEAHHYSRRYPAARFNFGLFDRGALVGAAVFSRPFTAAVITNPLPWLDDVSEGAELGRFVLLDSVGANAETFFLARCFAMLRGRLRAVVSFSDPNPRTALDGRELFPGHIGTIYQASNATYAGKSDPDTLRLLPDATVFSNMSSGKIRRKLCGWRGAVAELERWGAAPLAEDASDIERALWLERWRGELTRPMRHQGLHRYTFALDRAAPKFLGPRRAYPKQIAA